MNLTRCTLRKSFSESQVPSGRQVSFTLGIEVNGFLECVHTMTRAGPSFAEAIGGRAGQLLVSRITEGHAHSCSPSVT
jgi:hypothetical protein